MNKQSLQELRDKVAAGGFDNLPKRTLWEYFDIESKGYAYRVNANAALAYHGSTDAAVAFLEAVLPGWDYSIYTEKTKHAEVIVSNSKDTTEYSEGFDLVPARALLLATLDALIERFEND